MNSHFKFLLLTVISSATEWSTKTISAVTPVVSSMNVTRCIIKTKVRISTYNINLSKMSCAMFLLYIETHNAKGVAEMSWIELP